MIKVTELSENEIEEIGEAFADYNYADGEKGMSFLYNGRDSVKEYIWRVRTRNAGRRLSFQHKR